MFAAILSITTTNGTCLRVSRCGGRDEERQDYPLTTEGQRRAGADLYRSGAKDWLYSSSIDLNAYGDRLRSLVMEGFNSEKEFAERAKLSLTVKMVEALSGESFQSSLTAEEKSAYHQLVAEITS